MRSAVVIILLLAAAAVGEALAAQQDSLTLELVTPDPGERVYGSVSLVVWRLSRSTDSVTWSFRVGERDLSRVIVRRGREFIAELPADSALGVGRHRVVGDVCLKDGRCATSDLTLEVLPEDLQPPEREETRKRLLKAVYEVLRLLLRIPPGE